VSWAAVSDASSYTVSYKVFGAADNSLISNTGVSPYTISGLIKKTQYAITVTSTVNNV
jgi:hypothetical protein